MSLCPKDSCTCRGIPAKRKFAWSLLYFKLKVHWGNYALPVLGFIVLKLPIEVAYCGPNSVRAPTPIIGNAHVLKPFVKLITQI